MLNYDQNNQSILIQLTKDNQCLINSIPYNNQINNQKTRKCIPTKSNSQGSKSPINIISKFPVEDLNLSLTPTDKNTSDRKNISMQNENENEDNLLLSFSRILDASKTSTNSIIFNKDQSKDISMCNYYDKTPVNEINITSEVNNGNSTNTNTKKNLNQLFNNISGDKKTPLKYLKNQIQNKNEDEYLNYDIYNKNCGKTHRNSNITEMSDNDNKINLFTKYEDDNDTSNQNISDNKTNMDINITPSTKKNNSKESINDALSNKISNNNKNDRNVKINEFCIENLININIEKPIKNYNNQKNFDNQKKILVNRVNFKELKLKSKNRTCSTIGISNFNVFFNGIENININNNYIQNNDNNINNHNYVDMSDDKEKLINSPGNSNTDTVVRVSKTKKNIKISQKILINEQENISNNIQLKTDRTGTNNLNLTLSNKSSYKKNNLTNNKKKFSIAHQMKDKLKTLLEKHKDYLSENIEKNKYINKLRIKEINSNFFNFSHKTLNGPLPSRITNSNKNFNNNSTRNINNTFKNIKNKNNNPLINNSHFIKNCNGNKNSKKNMNKSTKNLVNSQKILNGCNSKKVINNYISKNNYQIQTERNTYANGLYNEYSNLLKNNNGIIYVNKVKKTSETSRNISKKNNEYFNSYHNFVSSTTRVINGASRQPSKIIQNFNFYNKKRNYGNINQENIKFGLNLDNSENISISANSITTSN